MTARSRRTRARGRVAAAFAVLGAATVLVVVVPAVPASAHDVLVSTSPTPGSTVDAAPAAVVLTFDRPALALGTALEVTGPSGDVASGPAALVDSTVRQALRSGAPAGAYTVRWRVTSADGHPVSGSFVFTALAAGGDPTATAAAPTTAAPTGAATAGVAAGASVLWWATTVVGVAIVGGIAAVAGTRRRRRRDDGSGTRRAYAEGNER